jgi:ectoine hydroxylase-related dioxygenase (phytanoyl-CoA dioxygenase family)
MTAPTVRREVTADEIDRFWSDGVVHLPQVLDVAGVAAMAGPVERVLAGAHVADLGALAGGTGPRFSAGVDHWRNDDDFRRFACESALPSVAAAVLRSEAVWLYEDSVLVKEPGATYRTEFHTDAGYFHVRGDQVCTFWVPLDRATPATGAVEYVRGSHRWPREFRPNLFTVRDPLPGTEGDEVPDVLTDPALRDTLVTFSVEPGDVVVHHYRTLHGAPGNQSSTQRRRAISVRYCGADVRHHLRRGAPRKSHQGRARDGDPLGGPDCPQVWPPGNDLN